jgi:hypothetical protein
VLAYSPELAEAVMRGDKPLKAAFAEACYSQGRVLNEGGYLVTLMGGEKVYEIEATSAAGEEVAVYVTSAGEIVEREKEQGEDSD